MLVTRWFTRCQRKINHLELRAMISAPLWSRVGSSLFEMFEPVYPVDCGSAQFALIGPYYHHRGVYFRWQFNAFSKHRHPKKTRAINLNMQINLQTPTGQDHQSKWRCIRFYVCFQTLGSFSTVCASGCTGCGRSINENDIGGQAGWQTRVNQDPFTVEWTGYSHQKKTPESANAQVTLEPLTQWFQEAEMICILGKINYHDLKMPHRRLLRVRSKISLHERCYGHVDHDPPRCTGWRSVS